MVPDLSKFQPGPAPRAEIRTYSRSSNGVVVTVTTTDRSGAVHTVSYPWRPDGSAARVTGSKSYDTIRLKQIDSLTFEASLSQGTKIVATERRGLAKDGQTMTIIVTDLTSGKRTTTVRAVFEKQ